jgi:hypothetical protein
MNFSQELGLNPTDQLYTVLNNCGTSQGVADYLTNHRADLAFVLDRLQEPSKINRDLADRLTKIEDNHPKLDRLKLFFLLKNRIDPLIESFNKSSRPNEAQLTSDLTQVVLECVKETKNFPLVMEEFKKRMGQEKGIRFPIDQIDEILREKIIKEFFDTGDRGLAKFIKEEDLQKIPSSTIEANLERGVALFNLFPNGNKTPLSVIMTNLGAAYLTECQKRLSGEENKCREIDEKLSLLADLLPEEMRKVEGDVLKIVEKVSDKKLVEVKQNVTEANEKGVLESISALIDFLNGEISADNYITCLIRVNECLGETLQESVKSDLWLKAFVRVAGGLFERATTQIQDVFSSRRTDLEMMNQVKQMVNQIGARLGRQIDVEVEMETESDILVMQLATYFPHDDIRAILSQVNNRLFFEDWLASNIGSLEGQGDLQGLIDRYKETGFDEIY